MFKHISTFTIRGGFLISSVSVGFGVGVGLGIPIVIFSVTVAIMFYWLCSHHRENVYGKI